MRVLLTAHRYWPQVGGTEEVVEQLATRFARAGHDVTVATQREPDTPEEEVRNGVTIRRFDLVQVGKFRFPPRAYREFVARPEWDVVHLHGQRVWSTDYLYAHLGKVPAPVVFTAHGFYQYHMERAPLVNDWYYHVVLPRVLRKAAAVTALTEKERGELASWGVPAAKVRVIPNGFDASEFDALPVGFREKHAIPADAPLLLYVGGFYPNKHVDRIVDAVARMRTPGAWLAAIGPDKYPKRGLGYCARLAARRDVNAVFPGRIPREDVLAAYAESDLFLYASTFEGFGLALLEAMAAGVPFVSTPAGAAPDLARVGGGVVVEDAQGMADAADGLLADGERLDALAKRARESARGLDWDAVAPRYLALYEEVRRS